MSSVVSLMAGAVGLVPLLGREPLVSAVFRDRPVFLPAVEALWAAGARTVLVAAAAEQGSFAAEALRAHPGVEVVECPRAESWLREAACAGDVVVVHDPLCPLVPVSGLRHAVDRWEAGTASVAVLEPVDTVKATRGAVVSTTLDRGSLRIVGSPVVLSGALLADLGNLTETLSSPAGLVASLAERCPLRLEAASPLSMRVEDESALRVLASLGAVVAGS